MFGCPITPPGLSHTPWAPCELHLYHPGYTRYHTPHRIPHLVIIFLNPKMLSQGCVILCQLRTVSYCCKRKSLQPPAVRPCVRTGTRGLSHTAPQQAAHSTPNTHSTHSTQRTARSTQEYPPRTAHTTQPHTYSTVSYVQPKYPNACFSRRTSQ